MNNMTNNMTFRVQIAKSEMDGRWTASVMGPLGPQGGWCKVFLKGPVDNEWQAAALVGPTLCQIIEKMDEICPQPPETRDEPPPSP